MGARITRDERENGKVCMVVWRPKNRQQVLLELLAAREGSREVEDDSTGAVYGSLDQEGRKAAGESRAP